jgi:hypothetical protein
MDKQVEYHVKLRNAYHVMAEAENEFILSMAPPEVKAENNIAEEKETIFSELNYDREEGPKIKAFEAAYKADNLENKWIQAYNILKSKKATINDRYHNEGYQHSYWLYEGNKIYRQPIKAKPKK